MSMVGGGYNNNPGFNPLAALRKRFDQRSRDRFELAKIEYEHGLAMQRAAQDHQYAQERMMQEWGYRSQESQAQRDFEGNMRHADRTYASHDAQAQRDFEMKVLDRRAEIDTAAREQTAALERKSQNNQGRLARRNATKAQEIAETLPPGAQASGGGISASAPKDAPATPAKNGNRKTTTANKPRAPRAPKK